MGIQAFYAASLDERGAAPLSEINAYLFRVNTDPKMKEKFTAAFNRDKSASVTLDQYCNMIGITPKEASHMYEQSIANYKLANTKTAQVVECTLSDEEKKKFMDDLENLREQVDDLEPVQVATVLKTYMDEKLGKTWHVIINQGGFWGAYSHDPNGTLTFKLNDYAYML